MCSDDFSPKLEQAIAVETCRMNRDIIKTSVKRHPGKHMPPIIPSSFILINKRQLHNTSCGGRLEDEKTSHDETHQHGSRYTRLLHARSRSGSGVVSGVGIPSGSLIFNILVVLSARVDRRPSCDRVGPRPRPRRARGGRLWGRPRPPFAAICVWASVAASVRSQGHWRSRTQG